MSAHSCPRCGYETDVLYNFKNHLSRKNTCLALKSDVELHDIKQRYGVDNEKHECTGCHKVFATKNYLYEHARNHCKGRRQAPIKTPVHDVHKELAELKEQYEQLKQIVHMQSQIKHEALTNVTINNNITNNIQQNIVLDFGNENTSYLTHEFLKECLLYCQPPYMLPPEQKENGITMLLKKIHANAEHPENHNVRIRNINRNLLETKVQGRWVACDKDTVLTEMISKGYRIISMFHKKHRDDLEDVDAFEGIMDEIEDHLQAIGVGNKQACAVIQRDLIIMLVNQKESSTEIMESQ